MFQIFQRGGDVFGLARFVDAGEAREEDVFGGRGCVSVARVRPEDAGGIADLDTVFALPLEEFVENGGVGGGRRFRDGGVLALLMAVGSEGLEVERYDGCAGGLGTPHAFDGRVKPRDRATRAADETQGRFAAVVSAEPRPKRPRGQSVVNVLVAQIVASKGEDDVLVLHLVRPFPLGELLGPPRFDETQKGQQAGIVRPCQRVAMAGYEGCKARAGILIGRCGDRQSVSGFVP